MKNTLFFRNDLKFDEVIVENLKETENLVDTETFNTDEKGVLVKDKNKKNLLGMAMSVGDVNNLGNMIRFLFLDENAKRDGRSISKKNCRI